MEDLRRIETLYKEPFRQFVEVYSMWQKNLTPPLTWLTIVQTLELMSEKNLSKQLRDKYAVTSNC